MSAAEPASDPVHARALNAGGGGAVIDFTKRRRGGALQAAQGRWTAMATPPKRDDGPPGGDESLRLFADDIEQSFNKIEQSLTDTRTAATFLKALDVWERVLQGSHATGHLGDEEAAKLLETLGWMRQAPRLV